MKQGKIFSSDFLHAEPCFGFFKMIKRITGAPKQYYRSLGGCKSVLGHFGDKFKQVYKS